MVTVAKSTIFKDLNRDKTCIVIDMLPNGFYFCYQEEYRYRVYSLSNTDWEKYSRLNSKGHIIYKELR